MSSRGFLEELLDGVSVGWKLLGDEDFFEVANRDRRPVKSSLRVAGETPYYGANNVQDYVDGFTHNGEYVLIAEDGSASLENYSIQYATAKFWANNHVHVLRGKQNVNTRYLFHYLHIVNFSSFLTGGGRAKLTKGRMIEIPVPIPCPEDTEQSLAIQAKIVRILDSFTELTAGLTAELTAELRARKQQYVHYRDKLLSFEDGEVEWKALGELFEFKNGINKGKEFFGRGDPIVNFSDIHRAAKLYQPSINGKVQTTEADQERFGCNRGDVFFTRTSESKEEIGYASVLLSEIPQCVFSGFIIRARPTTNLLLPDYCAYCFKSYEVRKEIIRTSNVTTRVTTTGTALSKIRIPVPSTDKQARIVAALDQFDKLTKSLSEGLPREIQLRRKQYEYYRGLLLSFPKPEEAA